MSDTRQQAILASAREGGEVTVDALSARFSVSVQTIRKDLNRLCDERLLVRTHGGARIASRVENMSYEARRMLGADAKRAIGEAVARLIPASASLFINIGTTTEAVAAALRDHDGLMVITNNLNVATVLRPQTGLRLLIASGEVRSSDGGIVGEAAVEFIRQFKVDYAIVGASAIDQDGALMDFDYREVMVAQAIIENARHVVLAVDASKHERTAPVRIGHLSQVGTVVTDRCPGATFRRLLDGFGIELIETG